MARRGVAGVTFALLLMVALGPWATPATAARKDKPSQKQKSEDAKVSKKAWFQSAPPCATVDCATLPAVNPYPEGTLHVAVVGGQETARTYLALEFELPADTEPTGGTLGLPVDADATHGSVSPETASIVACATIDEFKNERGATAAPPKADCDIRRSAVYQEKKALFVVDLGRFTEEWVMEPSGEWTAALALVPAPSAQADSETWHAVFPATDPPRKKSERAKTPVIAATIEYGPAEDDDLLGPPLFGSGGAGTSGGSGEAFDSGSGTGSDFGAGSDFGSGSSDAPADAGTNDSGVGSFGSAAGTTDAAAGDTATTPVSGVAAPPGSLVGFAGPGFAYPIMWALPLTILVALAATGRALTKDLYRRGL